MKITTPDDWTLDLEHRPPDGDARGAVLLLPAMMVDRRSMDKGLAETFRRAGYHVWLGDFRGHGASGPVPADGGSWTYDDLVWRDVPAFVEAIRHETPGRLILAGQSLGSHVSAATAAAEAFDQPPDAWVLLSANIWKPSLEPDLRRRIRKRLTMESFLRLTRLWGYFPSRRLRQGPADEAGPYVEDLVRFWREDAWCSRGGYDYLANLWRVRGPVLSLIGADDEIMAHPVGARNWARFFKDCTFEVVGRGDHGLSFDPDHMTITTDVRAQPLWDRIVHWLDTA